MRKLSRYDDYELEHIINEHVIFSETLNLDTIYDRNELTTNLGCLFYQKKTERLLLGIIIGMLVGFAIAGVMFVIGRF